MRVGGRLKRLALLFGFFLTLACALPAPALAAGESIIAVAADQPITQRDIDERIALLRILGEQRTASQPRTAILKMLVDDVVKRSEAKRLQTMPTDVEITKQVAQVAKGMNMSGDQLLAKLQAQGVSTAAFRTYLQTQIGFSRIISSKYQGQFSVSDSDVDRKMGEVQAQINGRIAQIMKDPRMQGVTVYSLLEIDLPVETPDDIGLIQARAVDAQQVLSRLKGCGSARAAASGVFNVKIGKTVDADASKLPPQMKAALDKAGVGHAIGPMRSKTGIQLLALCGSRRVTPPMPKPETLTREQVKNVLQNEKFDSLQEVYLKTARKNVYVEYRDPAYAP
jgi:peptidyl-prolyl cis-trans isomerase SurA